MRRTSRALQLCSLSGTDTSELASSLGWKTPWKKGQHLSQAPPQADQPADPSAESSSCSSNLAQTHGKLPRQPTERPCMAAVLAPKYGEPFITQWVDNWANSRCKYMIQNHIEACCLLLAGTLAADWGHLSTLSTLTLPTWGKAPFWDPLALLPTW